MDITSSFERKTLDKIVRLIIFNSISLLLIFILTGVLWFFDYSNTERTYRIKSLLQIEADSGSLFSYDQTLVPRITSINLEEQSQIYKSRGSLIELIELSKLDFRIDDQNGSYVDQFENNYFDDVIYSRNDISKDLAFQIEFNESSFNLYQNGRSFDDLAYGKIHKFKDFEIAFIRDEKEYFNQRIYVVLPDYDSLINWLSKSVILNSFASARSFIPTSLIEVFTVSSNTQESRRIIDSLNRIYMSNSVKNKSEQAKMSGNFIDERINDAIESVGVSETKLNKFQSENLLFEVGQKGRSYVEQLNELETKLNTILLDKVENQALYNPESQILKNIEAQEKLIKDRKLEIEKEISNLPEKEQLYVNLLKEVEVKQSLLDLLRNKKLEFSIVEASTISDIRVIDKAYTAELVSPRLLYSLFFYFCLGIVAAGLFLIIKSLFFSRIQSPSELIELDRDHDFLGVIPLVTGEHENEYLDQIRSVANNLNIQLEEGQKTILISGPIKGIGKTFSSINIAYGLAYSGKRVVVIDCDWRRGDLHKNFNIERTKNLSTFSNVQESVKPVNFKGTNFDILPAPRGSSEQSLTFFYSKIFKDMVEELKQKYDLVIFDSPPILAVTDTLTLSSFSDAVVLVSRHKTNSEKQFSQSLDLLKTVYSGKVFSVYNAFVKPPMHYEVYYNYYSYYSYNYYYKDEYKYQTDETNN